MPAASLLVPVAASVAGGIINKKQGGKFSDIVGPAAGLIGAGVNAYGQAKATSAQGKANAAALAFQREQEAARKKAFDDAMGRYEAKWNVWNNNRNAYLARLGVPMGSAPTVGTLMSAQPGAVPRQDYGQAPMGAPAAPPQAPMAPGGQMDIQLPQRAQTVGAMMRPELRYGMAR